MAEGRRLAGVKFDAQRLLGVPSLAVAVAGAALGACTSSGSRTAPAAMPLTMSSEASTISADELVGKWGLASYREEKDIARTEAEANAACGNPYVIGRGAAGGVMMHLADQTEPTELTLKGAAGGRNFIGPASEPPGGPRDREITSFTDTVFVASWVDPAVATRYGTFIYARCSAAA